MFGAIVKLRMFAAASRAKLDAFATCFAAQPRNLRTIVFCNFLCEMDAFEQRLRQHHPTVEILRISGDTSLDLRQDVVDRFMYPGDDLDHDVVLLMQIKSGGVGLNLQKAQRVYITSPSWNATDEMQALARAHRIGTTSRVVATRFVTEDTIEAYMHLKQQHKLHEASNILNDERILESLRDCDNTPIPWRETVAMFGSDVFDT